MSHIQTSHVKRMNESHISFLGEQQARSAAAQTEPAQTKRQIGGVKVALLRTPRTRQHRRPTCRRHTARCAL